MTAEERSAEMSRIRKKGIKKRAKKKARRSDKSNQALTISLKNKKGKSK
jgi:hypothetical protein